MQKTMVYILIALVLLAGCSSMSSVQQSPWFEQPSIGDS
jgi:uncharacterized lipoprotein YajG